MSLNKEQLTQIIEALLFVATEPLTVAKIMEVTEQERSQVMEVLADLAVPYNDRRGIQLVEVAGGYQLVTRPETGPWVKKFLTVKTTSRLSKAGLETLAIVAYKQPIVRDEIEKIRGVDCGGVLRTLLDKGLVRLVGRKTDSPGLPFLYGTTKDFLKYFGLNTLIDLPTLKEFKPEEILDSVQDGKMIEITQETVNS